MLDTYSQKIQSVELIIKVSTYQKLRSCAMMCFLLSKEYKIFW